MRVLQNRHQSRSALVPCLVLQLRVFHLVEQGLVGHPLSYRQDLVGHPPSNRQAPEPPEEIEGALLPVSGLGLPHEGGQVEACYLYHVEGRCLGDRCLLHQMDCGVPVLLRA